MGMPELASAFRRTMRAPLPLALLVLSVAISCATEPAPRVPSPPDAGASLRGTALVDAGAARSIVYPATRRVDAKDVLHGVDVPDPFRWLEDGKAAEVLTWMHQEDDLARAELSKIPIRNAIRDRLKALARRDEQDLPVRMGTRLFYRRRDADRDRAVVYYREGEESAEHVLLDPDAWAADKSLSLQGWTASWDGKKVAYVVTRAGGDAGVLHIMDVATRKVSEVDVLDPVEAPNVRWTHRSDGFYYQHVPADPASRAKRFELADARFHRLGDDPKRDAVVRPPTPGQTGGVYITLDPSGHWLVATVSLSWSQKDVYFKDLRARDAQWRTLVAGKNALFDVRVFGDTFYVRSEDGAPNGEVFAVDPRKPEQAAWRRIVPEDSAMPLMGFDLLGGRLILRYRKDVIARVEVRNLDGTLVRALPVAGIGTTTFPEGTPEGDEVYYGFWSYHRPLEIHRASLKNGTDSVWYQPKVPADLSRIQVDQVFFTSKDGTRAPMFLVHPRDMRKDGAAPTILYGYGGFNQATVPYFDPEIIPWVERGGVYALANLRGGSEYGETWHRAGMKRQKQNVFDDFVSAAEFLVREGYTSSARLASFGASNGGLLVAATLTQRPDLFRAVLCGEPLIDMVRYPLFGNGGVPELGNPQDPGDFRALFAYSPYHHVVAGTRYPSVLITAAAADERADAMHARKFAAALQAATKGGPVLLRVDWDSGHMGSDSVAAAAEKTADEYAFALEAMGLTSHR